MQSIFKASLIGIAFACAAMAFLPSILSATATAPLTGQHALLLVGAIALVAFATLTLRTSRDEEPPRMVARQLGERGQTVPQIARSLNMSQDAVRGLLGPDPSPTRNAVRGNNCRKNDRNRRGE